MMIRGKEGEFTELIEVKLETSEKKTQKNIYWLFALLELYTCNVYYFKLIKRKCRKLIKIMSILDILKAN